MEYRRIPYDSYDAIIFSFAFCSDMIALPKPTPKGYRILVYRLKDYDASKLQFNNLVRCFCAFNMVKISEDGLVPGYVVILDMKGVTFSHFMRVTPYLQTIRYILQYLQASRLPNFCSSWITALLINSDLVFE